MTAQQTLGQTHTHTICNKYTCSQHQMLGDWLFVLLPTGTVRPNQAAGLRWFTVALKLKIGHKELTVLGSRGTQLQVMLGAGCAPNTICVFTSLKRNTCLSMFYLKMFCVCVCVCFMGL